MWLRRIVAVSSTHRAPASAGIARAGAGTRDASTPAAAAANAAAASATSATARSAHRRPSLPRARISRISLLAESHLDVAGRTHVLADVAPDALVVVGVDVAPRGRLLLRHPGDRRLRTVDDAVVALEALAAAHAALRLGDGLRLGQRRETLVEVAERRLLGQRDELALDARRVAEVPEEQLLVRDHVAVGAVVVVVDPDAALVGAMDRLVRLSECKAVLDHLARQVEGVDVDPRPLLLVLAA